MNTLRHNSSAADKLAQFLCLVLLLGICLLVFGPGGDDDGHITYTAAKNLADTYQISNNNGERVEQGSSLLHVLALGTIYKLLSVFSGAIDMVAIGPLFSLFFAALCLPLTYSFAKTLAIRQAKHATLLLSLSTGFTYWAMGGLESTLTSACVLYYLFAVHNFMHQAKVQQPDYHLLLSTLCFLLARPEAFFVLLAFLLLFAALLVLQGKRDLLQHTGVMAVYAIGLFILVCIWRYYYFGQAFPQPVYAKAEGLSLIKIGIGLFYFIYSAQLSLIIYTLLLYNVIRQRLQAAPELLAAFSFTLAYLAFIVASGGDWMAGGRFFVPIIPLMIVLALHYLQQYRAYKPLLVALVVLSVIEIGGFSLKLSAGMPFQTVDDIRKGYSNINWRGYAWSETANLVHVRDIPVINTLNSLIDALPAQGRPWVVASIQMGMVPYHLHQRYQEKVYVVDLRGLTTRHLSQCKAFAGTAKTWSGIAISYDDYFDALQECRLPRPDIIYDLLNREPEVNAERLATVQREGYTIVYRQQGKFMPSHGMKSVDADTFIAVSPDIYSELPVSLRAQEILFLNKP